MAASPLAAAVLAYRNAYTLTEGADGRRSWRVDPAKLATAHDVAAAALSSEAQPAGCEPSEQGNLPPAEPPSPHTREGDEGLIEALSRELGDCDDEICGNSRRNDCAYCATASRLVERVIGPVISRLKGELEEARYVKARYDRETIPELAGTAQEHFAGRLKAEAEVKELREALKPFADAGAQIPPPVSDGATCTYYRDSVFTAAHFRKARSLLSPSQEGLSSARASRDARSST